MEVIYYLTTLALFGVMIVTVWGLIKPKLWQRFLRSRTTRKMIAISGFTLFVACGLIISATEPADVKQARLARERAQKEASLIQKQQKQKTEAKQSAPKIEKKEVEEKQAITFSKERKNDPTLTSGETVITQAGKDGEKIVVYEVTYSDGKETGKVYKREIVKIEPVTEITNVGTYVAPSTSPSSTQTQQSSGTRIGAICKDGSRSNATGSGACSHHGGVARWLYN